MTIDNKYTFTYTAKNKAEAKAFKKLKAYKPKPLKVYVVEESITGEAITNTALPGIDGDVELTGKFEKGKTYILKKIKNPTHRNVQG